MVTADLMRRHYSLVATVHSLTASLRGGVTF